MKGKLYLVETKDKTRSVSHPIPSQSVVDCKVWVSECEKDIFLLLDSSWLTIIYFQCGVKGSGSGDYISGGLEAKKHAHPWQVKFKQKTSS